MQTDYVLRVRVDEEEKLPKEVQLQINQIILDAKMELSKLNVFSSLTVKSSDGEFDDEDYEEEGEEDDLSFLDEPDVGMPMSEEFHQEVQRVSEMLLLTMSSPGQTSVDPMKAIRGAFPANAPRVSLALSGDIDVLDELDVTDKALLLFVRHTSEALITIVSTYVLSCYDVHKLFGLLLSGKTDIDSAFAFFQYEIQDSEFEDLPLDKATFVGTLEFIAQLFNFQFFSIDALPEVDNPMTDLGCLFGEPQKPNLRIIKS